MLGYYQSSNVRDRVCNKITPNQIKTDNYTHLYWAFASIDPTAFTIKLADSSDEEYAREFTALKGQGKNLETWVAVGGFDFSDNGTSTHTTWSDLCADAARRSAFIISAATFMADYGFQGIDIDWEYPVDSTRGGTDADLVNFVTLLQEMKAQFGGTFGISLTLAPDYWYLRNFDVAGLEPYVDFFGFMAYDLHGYWDADVKTLEPIVRGQADIREIYNDTIPLAYAGVDFNKINLGVAWYGRGYTLSDPSCNTLGCGFTGPNKPAACTNSAGVMSLKEIQDMIDNGEAESNLLEDAAMKELVWDDQWVGYDDEETVELKRKFANNYCFGGLMAWSVDFEPGTVSNSDDDSPAISTDGRCGPDNGGLTCVGSSFGNCCSGSGYCGSTEDYCGTGCVSGDCTVNGTTTNGRCGAGFYGATCAGTDFGSCCSAGGYCGDTDAHCGDGCQSGNCTDTDISLPGKGVDSDETCSYDYDSDDSSVVLAAWVDSGADDWFKNFLDEEGAEDWTNKFFEAVLAGGTSKGSPYDCTVMNTGQCDGPGSTLCTSYTPPETYYIHMQIGNMYSAFNMLWASTIQSAIENLSEGIKDIVDTYGTPPESDNSMMLDMFIGILTSLAGVAIEKSEAAGPFAFFSEMFSTLTESDGWSKAITPDELNDELETAYGEWFEAIMNSTYSYIENIFGGTRPDGLSDSVSLDDWVYSQFSSAQWLSKPAVDDAVTAYFDGIQKTWVSPSTPLTEGGNSSRMLTGLVERIRSHESYENWQHRGLLPDGQQCKFHPFPTNS